MKMNFMEDDDLLDEEDYLEDDDITILDLDDDK